MSFEKKAEKNDKNLLAEKKFDVIIIGAGASGAMCACTIKNKRVAIIDSTSKVAKKIMVTGNGKCNLTNTNVTSEFYNTNIDKFLARFDQRKTLEFFGDLGLVTFSDEEGRVYPISNSAKSVVDVLNFGLKENVSVFLGEKVQKLAVFGKEFVVETDKNKFYTKKLVVATGGNSSEILEQLGVKYKQFVPSLVSLKSNSTRDLNGIRLSNVLVKARNRFGEEKSEKGEVLFRENGLSGIVVFNLSVIFARRNDFLGEIEIDILPDMKIENLVEMLKTRRKLNVRLDKFFVGMFMGGVANEIFKQSKINTNIFSDKLSDEEILTLAKTIKSLKFEINGHLENNQVFSGGISLDELDENLMCKNIPNLYFIGEVVDVDGVCGGYNLQWAWTSGHIVGEKL